MNTNNMTQEQISAFADGELNDAQIELVMAGLQRAEGRQTWDCYHQIGDVLRSDELAVGLSADFNARMSALLDAEPVIIAPGNSRRHDDGDADSVVRAGRGRRFAMPGIAAAAVAAFAFVATPQLMVAFKSEPSPTTQLVAVPSKAAGTQLATADVPAAGSVVLRDPRIDEYLLAHQRFSPSVYSTAQYARSATFATDSGK